MERKSIEDLEGEAWSLAVPEPPGIVELFHVARRTPICELTEAQLLLLCTQGIGCRFLSDRLLTVLAEDSMTLNGELLEAALFRWNQEGGLKESQVNKLKQIVLRVGDLEEFSSLEMQIWSFLDTET